MKCKPIPGPIYVAYESDDDIQICRRWGENVTPISTATFGSGYGAHIAGIKFSKIGGATLEQARANADHIVAAWNHCEGFTTAQVAAVSMREMVDALRDAVSVAQRSAMGGELDAAESILDKLDNANGAA